MDVTVRVEGINLEKLLRAACEEGIVIRDARRTGAREMRLCVRYAQRMQLCALCERYGWTACETGAGRMLKAMRFLARRPALLPAMALGMALVFASSQMILLVRVEHAQEETAQIRRILREEGASPGCFKARLSLDDLRAQLAFRLPGISFAGLRYAGSTLICDGRLAVQGEQASIAGSENDIVAAEAGVITRISAASGTPLVEPGQAVTKGQVLIAGVERTQKGETRAVRAQGQVQARVYISGDAKASLITRHTTETGSTRTRVSVKSPWHTRVVRDAQPFESQDVSRQIQPVVGLYLPLWREIETYAQTEVTLKTRARSDAASTAQGAAEEIAKKQCPPGALILDKWVNYSMIDNEFVYATVVLEIETAIAGRMK